MVKQILRCTDDSLKMCLCLHGFSWVLTTHSLCNYKLRGILKLCGTFSSAHQEDASDDVSLVKKKTKNTRTDDTHRSEQPSFQCLTRVFYLFKVTYWYQGMHDAAEVIQRGETWSLRYLQYDDSQVMNTCNCEIITMFICPLKSR